MMKLKPCPFCGSEPTVRETGRMRCIECCNTTCAALVKINASSDWAEKYWNTRTEEPIEKTAHWDINCGEEPPAYDMTAYCPHCGCKMITRERDE